MAQDANTKGPFRKLIESVLTLALVVGAIWYVFGPRKGDWLVVQYAADGTAVRHWEIHGRWVYDGFPSGIQFTDDFGNEIRLEGPCARAKVAEGRWEDAKLSLLLKQ